jgi:hypothetical protein
MHFSVINAYKTQSLKHIFYNFDLHIIIIIVCDHKENHFDLFYNFAHMLKNHIIFNMCTQKS